MRSINVTQPFLPPIEEYQRYLKQIWDNAYLTNQGPLLREFEQKTKDYLGVADFQFVTNGTLALQLALRALDVIDGEIITTPFSYVATTSAILWERCMPVFVDIEPETFCIDANKIEVAITKNTKAIMAVHVFGFPCNVEKIQEIADAHDLKVIYDGAHAFGVKYCGKSLLDYGDITICSFHATKLFHTIEGGGIVARDKQVSQKLDLMKRFGHEGDHHLMLGMNAKASEFQAAMGLCNLEYIDAIIEKRKRLSELYDKLLSNNFQRPALSEDVIYNYGYYPILAKEETQVLEIITKLNKKNIFPRRYFYPSLNRLPYIEGAQACPVAEDIASRSLCLPLYADLDESTVHSISEVLSA